MRNIGCECCEAAITQLTHNRNLHVRQREAVWRAINLDCELSTCPKECAIRGLICRVSGNLRSFIETLDHHEDAHVPEAAGIEVAAAL